MLLTNNPQKDFESAGNASRITVYPLEMLYLLSGREARTPTGVQPTLLWLILLVWQVTICMWWEHLKAYPRKLLIRIWLLKTCHRTQIIQS